MTTSNRVIEFTIEGLPVAQPRARVTVRGKFAHAYTPKKHPVTAWRERIRYAASKYAPEKEEPGPVALEAQFFFPRPKNHYGTGKNANRLKESAPAAHITKPDTDNLIKPIKDVMEQIGFFVRDSQVCDERVVKKYTSLTFRPRVEVRLQYLQF